MNYTQYTGVGCNQDSSDLKPTLNHRREWMPQRPAVSSGFACTAEQAIRLEFPELAFAGICEDLRAQHVSQRRIGKRAVVKHRQGFTDGGVPGLGACYLDLRADANRIEYFLRSFKRETDAAHGARMWFYEAPMHAVSRAIELHPIRHWISRSRATHTAAICGFCSNGMYARRGGRGGLANADRACKQHFITLDQIQPLSAGAQFDFHIRWIFWLLERRVEG